MNAKEAELVLKRMRDALLREQAEYRGSQFTSYEAARTANAMADKREREEALSFALRLIAAADFTKPEVTHGN